MPLRILWASSLAADQLAPERFDLEVDLRTAVGENALDTDPDWPEVLVAGSPDERLLDGAALRHVIVPFTGIQAPLRTRMLDRPHLTLHNAHVNAGFVAQHALALLLACSNRVALADRGMRRGDWGVGRGRYGDSLVLAGRTCVLVGFGAIGKALLPMVEGLGMTVRVVRRGPAHDGDPPTFGPHRLHEAFAGADAVVVSLPGTEATEGLLGVDALASLPPHALVVNVGRGSVIDRSALYAALRDGALGGAGLDVWWRYPDREAGGGTFEPLPFHTLPTVVASPHRAAQVDDLASATIADVALTIGSLARGGSRNRVDPERGY